MSMWLKKKFYKIYLLIGRIYLTPLLHLEWKKHLFYKNINERPIEYGFAFKWLSRLSPKKILDVGTGTSAFPHLLRNCGFHVTAVDKIDDYWAGDYFNRHYHVINDDITNSKLTEKFDFITCISVLEHILEHDRAIKGMLDLLKPGGYLLLTFPFNQEKYVGNVYELPESGYGKDENYICQVFSRKEIDSWLKENPGKIIEQEYYEIFSGELWTFGEHIYPPRKVNKEGRSQLTCILIQKDQ